MIVKRTLDILRDFSHLCGDPEESDGARCIALELARQLRTLKPFIRLFRATLEGRRSFETVLFNPLGTDEPVDGNVHRLFAFNPSPTTLPESTRFAGCIECL